MISELNIPFLNDLKFVPNTASPGIHFDDDWMYNQIKSFERKVNYYRKWQVGESSIVQIESTLPPDDLKFFDCTSTMVLSIPFAITADGEDLGTKIYEAVVNLDTLPVNKVYYPYIKASFMSVLYEAIGEPIRLQTLWPGTLLFSYRNSYNDFGVAFTTGIQFNFRCEAGIMDFQPDSEDADYIDQIHNVERESGTAFRTFKLYIADEKGVAPWVLDLLNRIFICDYVVIRKEVTEIGLQYSKNTGAKWEINRVKGYPLYGGSLEIVPTKNASGLQFSTAGGFAPGLVTAYNMNSNFFGTTIQDQHILDITEN